MDGRKMYRTMKLNEENEIPIFKPTKTMRAYYNINEKYFFVYVKNIDGSEDRIAVPMKAVHQLDTRVRGVIRRFYRRK